METLAHGVAGSVVRPFFTAPMQTIDAIVSVGGDDADVLHCGVYCM